MIEEGSWIWLLLARTVCDDGQGEGSLRHTPLAGSVGGGGPVVPRPRISRDVADVDGLCSRPTELLPWSPRVACALAAAGTAPAAAPEAAASAATAAATAEAAEAPTACSEMAAPATSD